MIHFHLISIFPEVFEPYVNSSMMWRAQKEKKATVSLYNVREYSTDKHRKVDGKPYGGGPGMVMTIQPILTVVKKIIQRKKNVLILITSPRGEQFTNDTANTFAKKYKHIVIIAGHYEGIDARVKKILKAKEASVGDYVLTGGELPALIILDATVRQIDGALGNEESLEDKRVTNGECYTRPEVFTEKGKKYKVPTVLLSGNHKDIALYRAKNKKK
ncbi:MAG: tRNA (guanosine(37)-N1)-methyltransferase TrmD [Candidatus Paceibacterota bacterium]